MRYAFRIIEGLRDNSWLPDASLLPNIQFTVTSPLAVLPNQPYSNHAIAVANVLAGPDSPARSIITDIFPHHFSWFSAKCLGNARIWVKSALTPVSPYPSLMQFDDDPTIITVINASYGESVAQNNVTGYPADFYPEQNLFNRLKDYLDQTNSVMCASLPDLGNGYDANGGLLNFPGSSPDIISVGSLDFGHEAPNNRLPDCADYGYTSLTSPKVAAICMVLIGEFVKIGKSYTRQIIKDLLLEGCEKVSTPYTQGAGRPNLNNSLKIFSNTYGSIIVPPIIPPILPEPPIVPPKPINPLPKPLKTLYSFSDPTFSIPTVQSGEIYQPPSTPWSFSINMDSGIASDVGSITIGNDRLPLGSQVAFVTNQGWVSQMITLPIGYYHIRTIFSQAATGNQQVVKLLANGLIIGTLSTSNHGYITHYTIPFYSNGSPMPITFRGQNKIGTSTIFIARVEIEGAPKPVNLDIIRANAAMMVGGSYNANTQNFIISANLVDILARVLSQGL